jgi:hypothetical protein
MHQKTRLAVAVIKLLAGARVEFAFTLGSRFCHRELLCFFKWDFLAFFKPMAPRFNRGSRKQKTTALAG